MTPLLAYDQCIAAAYGRTPVSDMLVEIDDWLGKTQTAWEVYCLKLPPSDLPVNAPLEDFARVDTNHQRWFLLVAAVVLYGEDRDEKLRVDCKEQSHCDCGCVVV